MGKHSKNKAGWSPGEKSRPAEREAKKAHSRVRPIGAPRANGAPDGRSGAVDPRARKAALDAQLSPKVKRDRRRRTIVRSLVAVAVAVVVMAATGAAWAMYFVNNTQSQMSNHQEVKNTIAVLTKPEPQKPFTVLLLGADYRRNDTTWRTDTIILAKVDPENKRVWMLSIPRDTKVEVPGYGTRKINAAHSLGGKDNGPALMVKTVEKFTGVPINHYAEINFKGFQLAVDALGGVWIDVPEKIDDWKAASQSPGHRAQRIDPGYQKLDGEHALTFMRSRAFADADFTRMKHQQLFFKALASQLQKSPIRAPGVVQAVSRHLRTDMTVMEMLKVASAMKDTGKQGVYTATLNGEWRSPFVYTDEVRMASLIKAMENGVPFDKKPKKATASTEASSSIPPADITVAVRNGSGMSGMAAQAAEVLTKADYDVGEVGNAKKSDYERTLVVYNGPEDKPAAQSVAAALPTAQLVPGNGLYQFTARVLVVVGKDWKRAAAATPAVAQ